MEENAEEKAARLEAYREFGSSSSNMTLDDFKASVDEVSMTEYIYNIKINAMIPTGTGTYGYQAHGSDR